MFPETYSVDTDKEEVTSVNELWNEIFRSTIIQDKILNLTENL